MDAMTCRRQSGAYLRGQTLPAKLCQTVTCITAFPCCKEHMLTVQEGRQAAVRMPELWRGGAGARAVRRRPAAGLGARR